ncbi:MAG: POTRA domain-containing protein, partial [Candidatus Binatia bacterium]
MRRLAGRCTPFRRAATEIGAILCVFGWLTARSHAEVAPETLGLPVREILFDTPVSVDQADFRKEIPVANEIPLTTEAIQKSLEWLRAKETFSSVDVDVAEQNGSASVRFILVPADVIVGVEVHGAESVSETDVRRRARIREDELLSESRTAAASERLQRFYADRGYRDAVIRIRSKRQSPGRVVVQIRIREGAPTRIEEIQIVDLPAGLGRETGELLGFEEGDPFTTDRPARGREALTRFLRNHSYYEADVREAHEVGNKTASLWFEVRPGPPFDVQIEGNQGIERERLLGLTNLATRPIITNGTWRLLARRMQELYREEGYRFAEVQSTIEENGAKRVRFRVEEGPRVRVHEIRVRGARALSRREVVAAMETKARPAIPLFGQGSWFREDVLAEDRERVRERYRSAGYLDAKVEDVRSEFSEDRRTVRLNLDITEGPRSRVETLRIEGAEGLLTDPERGLELVPGAAYDSERLEEDRRRLVSRLAALGHAEADVATTVETSPEGESEVRITVRHRISPGPRIHVGKILIQQNYFTRDRVIRRELPFRSGDPFDPAMLVEAQRRLYR